MARKFKKIPQPPIDPETRPSESRHPAVGVLLAVGAAGLLWMGFQASHDFSAGGFNYHHSQRDTIVAMTRYTVARPTDDGADSADPPEQPGRADDDSPAASAPSGDATGPGSADDAGREPDFHPEPPPGPRPDARPKLDLDTGEADCLT